MEAIKKEIFELNGEFLKISQWEKKFGIFAGFSTRKGGRSLASFESLNLSYIVGDNANSVLENRQILAKRTPIDYSKWIFAEQKHTNNIMEVTKNDCGKGAFDFSTGIKNTDGMYTTEKGIMLATFHADCTPIYFSAPTKNLIGLVHAGWQGTVKSITKKLIESWFELGLEPTEINIVIGPSASQAAYEVGEDVATQVMAMDLLTAHLALVDLGTGKYKLDTAYLNYLEAINLGVPKENIHRTSYCTICDEDLFFSYRRDKRTGRMLAFISQ